MDIRALRYFLTVAKCGSVAAAARLLHVAQPALSRQISTLEDELNARLFFRLPRGVALTRAGEELVVRASQIVEEASRLKAQVALASAGNVGTLRIGVMPGYSWLPALGTALERLTQQAPATRLAIEPGLSNALVDGLKKHELDAAIVAWRSPLDSALTGLPIHRDRLVVAMPAGSELARLRKPRLNDFAGQHFIMFPRERSPTHFDVLMRIFLQAGVIPASAGVSASDLPSIVGLVGSGLGCAVVPESYGPHTSPDVVMAAVGGLDLCVDLEFVWRTGSSDPLLERFIGIWRELSESRPAKAF